MKPALSALLIILFLTGCGCQVDSGLYPVPLIVAREGATTGVDLSVYKKSPDVCLEILPNPYLETRFIPAADSLYLRPSEGAAALLTLPLLADGVHYELLVQVRKMVRHTFTYPASPEDTLVVVMGGFNDWSRTALPLTDGDGDGLLERTVYLNPERHEYKFVVDHEEVIDPANPVFISNNIGGWNSILDLTAHRPLPAGHFVKQTTHGSRLDFAYIPPPDGARPALLQVLVDNTLLTDQEVDPRPDGGLTVNTAGSGDGLLRLIGVDTEGRALPENQTILRNGRPLELARDPDDWHFAVIYSLLVDRFCDGDSTNDRPVGDPELHPLADFRGGDLAGIVHQLRAGHFDDLGVTALWISPVSRQPDGAWREWIPPHRRYTGYHGYWPVRPREVDPRFGTAEELHTLVAEAHDRGIKVLLDFVSNHVHCEHVYFREHPEWFGTMYLPDGTVNIRNWSEETRLTTWFDDFIPSFDYPAAPAAVDQVVDDACWWVATFGFDGFRQDAVKHVPHAFWKQLTAELHRRFPERDLYQIGETFGSDALIGSYVNPGELDSQFNFAIYFNARGPFSADRADFGQLATILENNGSAFGPVNLMGNITSSHDQVRFMAFADGQMTFSDDGTSRAFDNPPGLVQRASSYDKLVNFTTFNLCLPGVPVIYYGEEIGLMGAGDPDNRRPLHCAADLTAAERSARAAIAARIGLRRQYPALSVGDYLPLLADGPLLVFGRVYFDEFIVAAFNQSPDERLVNLPLPVAAGGASDLLSGERIAAAGGALSFSVPAYGQRLLQLQPDS